MVTAAVGVAGARGPGAALMALLLVGWCAHVHTGSTHGLVGVVKHTLRQQYPVRVSDEGDARRCTYSMHVGKPTRRWSCACAVVR